VEVFDLRMSSRLARFGAACGLAGLLMAAPPSARAWPAGVYPAIFASARDILPRPFQQLLFDMESVLDQPCASQDVDTAIERAIAEFEDPTGSPLRAVAALREAGCAAAAMNDPGMNALVQDQAGRFSVVFYGWHPLVQEGDIAGYLELRREALRELAGRYERTSDLPNRSDVVELSPEFGMASIAYSHAVTDVANVWLYIWTSVNGAF
jgi:hypothetical protein